MSLPCSRRILVGFCLGALLLAIACGRRGALAFPSAPVILISIDTLRADHLPAYGYRGVETPSLDALRKDSILFANAYSQVPLTLPSHVSLLTGLLPPENGVRDNYGYSLESDSETLASFLKKRGYATGAAVSAAVLERASGLQRGFDFYDDRVESNGRFERDGAATAKVLDGWIDTVAKRPFFAFLHLFEPHTPYEPPEPYRSRYRSAYDGEIARADEIVGAFLDHLKQRGLYDRALILFLSDHGEGLGDHGEEEHGVLLYREMIHVPLLLKLPGGRRGGERVDAPAALTDVFPTVARALGGKPPAGLPGVALTSYLEKGPATTRRIYSETFYPRLRLGWSDLASLVDERYHYIEAPRPELYDLREDLAEKRNLAAGLPNPLRSMRAELSRMTRPFRVPEVTGAEHARKLASLGYLTVTSPRSAETSLPDPKDRITELRETAQIQKLLAENQDEQLIRACRRFLEKSPAALDMWRILADALARLGAQREAVQALRRGLRESAATAAPALRGLALERLTLFLIRAGRQTEALEIADPPTFTDPDTLNAIGVVQAQAGRLEQARQTLERALQLNPNSFLTRLSLGQLFLKLGNLEEARKRLEEAVRLEPTSAPAWSALGQVRARAGDEKGALECWTRAVGLDANQFDALYDLGIAAGKLGDIRTAQRALQKFVASAPPGRYARQLAEARRLLQSIHGG